MLPPLPATLPSWTIIEVENRLQMNEIFNSLLHSRLRAVLRMKMPRNVTHEWTMALRVFVMTIRHRLRLLHRENSRLHALT